MICLSASAGVAYLDLDVASSDAESICVVTASHVAKTGNTTRRQPSQIYIVTPRGCVARLYDNNVWKPGFLPVPPTVKMQMHAADVLQRSP